jgi:uncharacterized phage protein (TIGR02220 family)
VANRFTDTEKWEDPWFRNLPPLYQRFWIYITDKCNHSGIWKVDMKLVRFYLKEDVSKDSVEKLFNGRITFLSDKEWFITKFVTFQQKVPALSKLNPNNNCHLGIIKSLRDKGLTKGLPRGSLGAKQGLRRGPGKGKGKVKVDKKLVSIADKLIDYFNKLTESSYKHSDTARGPIVARLNDGFTGDQCAAVIHKKYHQWKDDPKMCQFIRISTLFQPTKFEGYLNEKAVKEPEKRWLNDA